MRRNLLNVAWVVCAFSAAAFTGCSSPGRYNILVDRDPALGAASVEVHFVGVNPSDYGLWEAYPMSKYWGEGDPMRKGAEKYVMTLTGQAGNEYRLSKADPIWDAWKARGATSVLVLADISGIAGDQPGNGDPRRKIIPLDTSRWSWSWKSGWPVMQDVRVAIKPSGVSLVTPPKPE